jgi:non-ribosomal peptide synthase protein (TIGR01720 family)
LAGTITTITAEQGEVSGSLLLTPIQRWLFEQNFPEPDHWNKAFIFSIEQPLVRQALRQALAAIIAHHDALRIRFYLSPEGWQAEHISVAEIGEPLLEWVDISALDPSLQSEEIERRAETLQASLNLAKGRLIHLAYFDTGPAQPARLLAIVHHLVVDGVSWRILLEDLMNAYTQAASGQRISLPAKTTSYKDWSSALEAYAQSQELSAELGYWRQLGKGPVSRLPRDYPDGENTEALARSVRVALGEEETRSLLVEAPGAYGTEINDLLLAALVEALGEFSKDRRAYVELESHGRQELPNTDVTRTLGWFTAQYPVQLDLRAVRGPGETIKAVKEQLRRVPQHGFGYGLLRYLCRDAAVRAELGGLFAPEISFNYLGQVNTSQTEAGQAVGLGLAGESVGAVHSSRGQRSTVLGVTGSISAGRLRLEWHYSAGMYRRQTIEELADIYLRCLQALIVHCRSPEAVGYTPSDFPDAGLSEEDLDAVLGEVGEE